MSNSVTTSIRLDSVLRNRLEQASRILHRGKNWIISHALEEYLKKINNRDFIVEAHRQCQLVNMAENKKIDDVWENIADVSGWK